MGELRIRKRVCAGKMSNEAASSVTNRNAYRGLAVCGGVGEPLEAVGAEPPAGQIAQGSRVGPSSLEDARSALGLVIVALEVKVAH